MDIRARLALACPSGALFAAAAVAALYALYCRMRRHQSVKTTGPVRALAELQRLRHTPGHTGDLCAVCFEPVSVPTDGYLFCGHNFHKRCLEQRGAGGAAELCPVCHESEEAGAAHADYVRQALRTIRARWPEVGDASEAAFYAAASPLRYDPAAELALEGGLAKNPKDADALDLEAAKGVREGAVWRRAARFAIVGVCLANVVWEGRPGGLRPIWAAGMMGAFYYFLLSQLLDLVWGFVDPVTMKEVNQRYNERRRRYWLPALVLAVVLCVLIRSTSGVAWNVAAAIATNFYRPMVDLIGQYDSL